MFLRRKIAAALSLCLSTTTVRHRHSAVTRPFSQFRTEDRAKAIQRAQAVLIDYLHTVRTIPFTFAETICKNSLASLSDVVSKVELRKKRYSTTRLSKPLQRFLRYNPVNEFEFFYESIGIDVKEIDGFCPKNKCFLSDDSKVFDAACELYRFGFPWKRLGKLYKEERLVFDKDPSELSAMLEGMLSKVTGCGLSRSSLIGICIVFPHVLRGIESDFDALLSDLRRVIIDFDLISDMGGNVDDWIGICRKIRLFHDLGGNVVDMIGRCKNILLEYPEETLAEKVEYFCRFDVKKEEVGLLLLSRPEIFDFDLKRPKISVLGILKHFGLGKEDLDVVVENYPYVLGRNRLANLPHVMRAVNLNRWLFNRIKDGDHNLLSSYAIGSYDEDFDREFADSLVSLRSNSRVPQYTLNKLEFLHSIGYGENMLTLKVLKQLQGSPSKLQERFNCLVLNGIEFEKLCKMVNKLPKILNQQPECLEKKVKIMCQDSGSSFQYLDFSPADLCFDTKKRIERRHIFHTWLTETGMAQTAGRKLSKKEKCIVKLYCRFTGYKLLMMEMCKEMASKGKALGATRERNKEVADAYSKLSVMEKANLDGRAKEIRIRARQLLGLPFHAPKLRSRCSPNLLYQLADHIYRNPDKRKRVLEMGFGGLMTIQSRTLPQNFILELLEKFDPETRVLSIDGKGAVKVTGADVCRVLGIPCGSAPLPKHKDVPSPERHSLLERFPSSTALFELRRQLEETKGTCPTFGEKFIIYIMNVFLCPTAGSLLSSKNVSPGYAAYDPTKFNWGDHVLDFLSLGVVKLKKKLKKQLEDKKEKKLIPSCMGCVHFLLLFYIDQERMGCKPSCPDSRYPIGQWTDHDIRERMKKEARVSEEDYESEDAEDGNDLVQELDEHVFHV